MTNEKKLVAAMRKKWPDVTINSVDFAEMSFYDQVRVVYPSSHATVQPFTQTHSGCFFVFFFVFYLLGPQGQDGARVECAGGHARGRPHPRPVSALAITPRGSRGDLQHHGRILLQGTDIRSDLSD